MSRVLKRYILLTRHGVRNIPETAQLADGTSVPLQSFSKQLLPLYASTPDPNIDGNLSGVGWILSTELGKYLAKHIVDRWGIRDVSLRANIATARTIDTGIAIARSLKLDVIEHYKGALDPIFSPRETFGYTLPDSAIEEKQARYDRSIRRVEKVAKTIQHVFGVPLPLETKITKEVVTGRLAIEERFSQEPSFSLYSNINLGMSAEQRRVISQGVVLRQYVDHIPLYLEQQASNMATYILNFLGRGSTDALRVLVGNDTLISALASLLRLRFQFTGWATQYVNVNSGLLFHLSAKGVRVYALGLTTAVKFQKILLKTFSSWSKFVQFMTATINPKFVNLSTSNLTIRRRVS